MPDQRTTGDRPRPKQRTFPDMIVPRTPLGRIFSWICGDFPRIDRATFEARLALFTTREATSEQFQAFRRLRFRRLRTVAITTGVSSLLILVSFAVLRARDMDSSTPRPQQPIDLVFLPASPTWTNITLIALGFYTVATALYLSAKSIRFSIRFAKGADDRSQVRFYRSVGAMFAAWRNDGDASRALKLAGSAARALFLVIQTEQWTWASPPALSERAARLARPLLDVDTPDYLEPEQIDALCSFLLDVTIVVIAGREDLIPEVRRGYSGLKSRSDAAERAIERDILFLDPMRDRGRWEVMKDFVFPLASWLSLGISFVALLVSTTSG
ncbi:hypothetical protein AB0F52_36595 [Amycolatopsis sp. NPDC024027]|uniref:hypothetical protein n=1 Tax=Amycolatopsis sp. NPDC024027 TaxID=3154327 RepID=UPI0033F7663E